MFMQLNEQPAEELRGLARWGIPHLSPSTINKAVASFPAFVLDKVLRATAFKGNPATTRGHAVEAGLMHAITHPNAAPQECANITAQVFEQRVAMDGLDNLYGQRELAKAWDVSTKTVLKCSEIFRNFGECIPPVDGSQHRVEMQIDGLSVPIIGYLDLLSISRDGEKVVVDVKSKDKPAGMITSIEHYRQFAFYAKATGCPVYGAYVSPKGMDAHLVTPQEVERYFNDLVDNAMRIEKMLDKFENVDELISTIPVNIGDFYLKDDLDIARRTFNK